MTTTGGLVRCIYNVFEGRVLEESTLGNRTPTLPDKQATSNHCIPSSTSVFLPIYLREKSLHFPYFQNSESFIRAQPCMFSRYRPQQPSRLAAARPALREDGRGMQQPPGSCAHRAHSSWYGGIAIRDFEELPCGKVDPCLELPLGGPSAEPSVAASPRTVRLGLHRHRLVNSAR